MGDIKTEWDLDKHFFTSLGDERIEQTITSEIKLIDEFVEKYKNNITKLSDEEFMTFLDEKGDLFKGLLVVYQYYSRLSSLNTQDQEVLKAISVLSNTWSDNGKKLIFITEEYKELGYDRLMEMSEKPIFESVKNGLVQSANNLKYSLPEVQENNMIEVGKVMDIFDDIYSELTGSFVFEIDGVEKTKAEVYAMRLSPDSDEREKANKALYETYGQHKIVLGGLYKSVCKSNVADIKIRGYENVMRTRNISEQMDKETVDQLISSVKDNYPLYHKFLANKARLLGKEKLELSDVLAPIDQKGDSKMTFEEAYEIYMDKIKNFDEDFYTYSKEMFEDGRVSVFPSKYKGGGAYASYSKDAKSFVMLNHTEDFDSLMTLAHELGHAIHGDLEQVTHDEVYRSPLSLAETASIFNETLVFGDIIDNLTEDVEYYMVKKLDDTFSTMFRQIMYIDFERECHQRFLDGEEMGYEDFNDLWLAKGKEFYGEGVNIPDYYKYGWSVIPHIFHTPFYCYSYSFGNILSFNLYNMYEVANNKEEFKTTYKNILKAGGSKRPKDLLIEQGIDITSKDFYEEAFNVVREYINKLEEVPVS
jgi:oligoendopeptidase F